MIQEITSNLKVSRTEVQLHGDTNINCLTVILKQSFRAQSCSIIYVKNHHPSLLSNAMALLKVAYNLKSQHSNIHTNMWRQTRPPSVFKTVILLARQNSVETKSVLQYVWTKPRASWGKVFHTQRLHTQRLTQILLTFRERWLSILHFF